MPNVFIHNNSKYIVTNTKTHIETLILSQANTPTTPAPEIPSQPSNFDLVYLFSLIIPILIIAIFTLIFGIIGYAIIKGISITHYNSRQPIIHREAKVVSKRQEVSGGGRNTSTSTSYYITFEFVDGSRKEFNLSSREYGLIAEGDKGTLYSQGTWYKEFKRQV
ncbi:MAG: DUF2500 domain-containing protein [Calothrix sp. C42_A2020_038]|nr:DUF2500 domain-containing protein [Calothrix sp. C42_A2020_038]